MAPTYQANEERWRREKEEEERLELEQQERVRRDQEEALRRAEEDQRKEQERLAEEALRQELEDKERAERKRIAEELEAQRIAKEQEAQRRKTFQLMFSFVARRRNISLLGTGENEELSVEMPIQSAEQLLPLIKEVADSAPLEPLLELESQFQVYEDLQAELHRSPETAKVSERDNIMKSLLESKAIDESRTIPIKERRRAAFAK